METKSFVDYQADSFERCFCAATYADFQTSVSQVENLLTHRKWPKEHGGEPSNGLPTESRRYSRLENLRYDRGKPGKSEMFDSLPTKFLLRERRWLLESALLSLHRFGGFFARTKNKRIVL